MKNFKYFSYRDGCNCSYDMPDSEFERFEKSYNSLSDKMKSQFKTVNDFIVACLSLNN